jgi:hypothetical protein
MPHNTFNVERSLDARGRPDHLSGDAFYAAFPDLILERRDSIKATGCGQLSSVLKYAVLGEFMHYAPQTIAVSEQGPRAWGKQPPLQWRHRYAVP